MPLKGLYFLIYVLSLLNFAICQVVPSPGTRRDSRSLTIGSRTVDRPKGFWPGNEPNNGTGADSPLQPYTTLSMPGNVLWCAKIQIPAPGMQIQAIGIFVLAAGVNMKLLLYDDSEYGYPRGPPLVQRTFISIAGRNEFNLDPSEYKYWAIPFGGSDFVWLCAIHDNAIPAFFFVTNGSATDGPYKTWGFSNPVDYDWVNYDYTIAGSGYYEKKTNMYIYGPRLVTDTPTLTATTSPSRSTSLTHTQLQTPTPTVTATASSTASRTSTHTITPTWVPTFDPQNYVYNGIPAPAEVLTVPWVDFYPNTALVGEEITARVEGWHNFWEHDIYFKVGRGIGYNDCYGVQPGSSIQKMVNNTIKLRALRADSYLVCYKLRNDWEPLERRFNVTDISESALEVFEGYNSCQEFLTGKPETKRCGCFLGTVGEQVLLPWEFPLNLLLPRALDKVIEFGCCQDRSVRRVTVGSGREDWGWCTNP